MVPKDQPSKHLSLPTPLKHPPQTTPHLSLHLSPEALDISRVLAPANLPTPQQKGQVPTLRYSNGPINNEIFTESAVIAQFLADAHPSHLLPASASSPTAPLFRARVNFFLDTYSTKVNPSVFAMYGAATEEEKEQKSQELVGAMEKEIEPLLENANPFFGGSAELTLVEVCSMRWGSKAGSYACGLLTMAFGCPQGPMRAAYPEAL